MTDRSESVMEILPGIALPPSAWGFRFSRSSGPGGQNVNKLNTRATLRVEFAALIEAAHKARPRDETLADRLRVVLDSRINDDQEIIITSDMTRSQERNRDACIEILRDLVTRGLHRPRKRIKTKPSRSSQRTRLESKRRRGELKAMRQGRGEE